MPATAIVGAGVRGRGIDCAGMEGAGRRRHPTCVASRVSSTRIGANGTYDPPGPVLAVANDSGNATGDAAASVTPTPLPRTRADD